MDKILELSNYLMKDINEYKSKNIESSLTMVEDEKGKIEYLFLYDEFSYQDNIEKIIDYIKGIRDSLYVLRKCKEKKTWPWIRN